MLSFANDCCAALSFDYRDPHQRDSAEGAPLLQHGAAYLRFAGLQEVTPRARHAEAWLTVTMAKALVGRVRYLRTYARRQTFSSLPSVRAMDAIIASNGTTTAEYK